MKAAVFERAGVIATVERPEPAIVHPHDVKLAVLANGICGTDLHILATPPAHPATDGVVLGHEFVAQVAEIGSEVTTLEVGQRVAVRPIVTCGACHYCLEGAPNHCVAPEVHGVFVDGGLAEFAVMPDTACIPISESVPVEIAALTEPLACVLSAVKKAAPMPGENVVIFGAGAIGLLFTAAFKAAGARSITVIELAPARAEAARRLGATEVLDPRDVDVRDAVAAALPYGPEIVVDAVGSQVVAALDVAGRLARVVLFGQNELARAEIRQVQITLKELVVIGNFVGQLRFPDAVRFIESGVADLSPIVSDVYGLEEFPSKLDALRSGDVIKAVVKLPAAG